VTRGGRGTWRPALGAWPEAGGFRFRVWAPAHTRVDVVLVTDETGRRREALAATGDGYFTAAIDDVAAGTRYGFLLDDAGPFPDPASRWQPDGVHDLSATVDPSAFAWSDAGWHGLPLARAVFYELHVGTFTPAGTFAGVLDRLPYLVDLGVTAVELMPVADFPGARNWGYDGVCLFAPARCYGTPADFRRLVDRAHALGLAVILDVVYNHFGPDGAYVFTYSPDYASSRHASPWGPTVNVDGPGSGPPRAFFLENALHWIHEYRLDGVRLDATHAILDDSPRHLVADLTAALRASCPDRQLLIVAEDDRNLAAIVRPPDEGGWGADAVWADDFHHHVRRLAAGDADGYFQDFDGTTPDLADTLRAGWFYRGQHSAYRQAPRGTSPAGIPLERMVVCLQNHDQIGNRAFGDRLHHGIDLALYRALTVVLLTVPETPLLFMGQEWAASTPFQYFTDHRPDLGRLVTEGRRREFARFAAFSDEEAQKKIPDPQAATTYEASRLRWDERDRPPHAGVFALYRALLALRRSHGALGSSHAATAAALDADTLAIVRPAPDGPALVVVARFAGSGVVTLGGQDGMPAGRRWSTILTSEDAPFVEGTASTPPRIVLNDHPVVSFQRPSAVVLQAA